MVLSKKINHNIFRSIFGLGYSIGISLYAGAFKKDMQQKFSIELTFISRLIGILGVIQSHMITAIHVYPRFKI